MLAGSRSPAHVHAVPMMNRCRELLYCETSTLVRPAGIYSIEPHVGRFIICTVTYASGGQQTPVSRAGHHLQASTLTRCRPTHMQQALITSCNAGSGSILVHGCRRVQQKSVPAQMRHTAYRQACTHITAWHPRHTRTPQKLCMALQLLNKCDQLLN